MPRRALIAVVALAPVLAPIPSAHAREAVTTIKPLLVRALTSGRAEGVLVGPAAQAMSKRFGTSAPILVDVERIGSHRQTGCGRLRVLTRQAGVVEVANGQGPAQPASDRSFAWQVNYCATGRFPIGEEGD